MLWFLEICIIYGIIAGTVTSSRLDELKQHYMNVLMECMVDYPFTQSDINAITEKKVPNSEATLCFFACAFKKTGMMDDKGNLSVEGVRKATGNYLSDDPEMLRRSEEFTDACKSVNDVPVNDGEKGCERARLIYECSLEKAPKFNLF